MKIFKSLKGQAMDEDIFWNYFIKLYKSLALMESEFLKTFNNEER